VLVILDGARYDVLRNLLHKGELPNVKQHILARGSLIPAVSSFPSTTGPAYAPFLTGCFPGTVEIPGIRWMDKELRARGGKGWRRSYMGYEAIFFSRDLAAPAGTLFRHFRHPVNIFNMITAGLRKGGNASRYTKPLLYAAAHFAECWSLVDRVAGWHLLRAVKDRRNDLIVVVFPGVDSLTHRSHPFDRRVLEAYRWFDHVIGRAAHALLQLAGYDETLWMVVSDHGMTWTHSHFDLVDFLDRRGFRAMDYPRVFRRNARAAVMISGNAMANVYLQNSRGWYGRTYREDLERADGEFLVALMEQEAVDVLALRDYKGGIHIMSKRGAASLKWEDGVVRYRPLAGDPFGYGELPEVMTAWESLEATFTSEYPDALVQLVQLFNSRRSGDLIVSATKGHDLRANFEWPEHRASHGALLREQMIVPIVCSHPIDARPARTVDVFPTILKLMGKPIPAGIEGQSLV